jgi:chromosome segregation ATPase
MAMTRRIAGVIAILLAVSSIIFSIFLLVRLWQIQDPMEENLTSVVTLFSETFTTTQESLDLIYDTLDNASLNITGLQDAMLAMAHTINDTGSVIDDLNSLVDKDLPLTISTTQISLDSAGASAAVIDDVMTTLSSIPLINISYEPEKPLSIALEEISSSLDNIPNSLESLSKDLSNTQESLEDFEGEIIDLAEELDSIEENLRETEDVIDHYLIHVDQFQDRTDAISEALPGLLTRVSLFITFLLIWLLVIQIGFLLQGISLLNIEETEQTQSESQ